MKLKTLFLIFNICIQEILCKNQINESVIQDANKSKTILDKNSEILFRYKDEIDFEFPIRRNIKEGSEKALLEHSQKISLSMSTKMLMENNVTIEQVKRGWIEIDSKGEEFLVINGTQYPMELKSNVIMVLDSEDKNNSISINMDHFNEVKLEDIQDDPNLIPMEPLKVNWTNPERCEIKSLSVLVTGHFFELKINNETVKRSVQIPTMDLRLSNHEGLILAVINPLICNLSFYFVANTSDLSGFRDLIWGLDSISTGRLVVLASLRDGSSYLGNETRRRLHEEGSHYAPFYYFRDSWISLFFKGGKTLLEAFARNLREPKYCGSPLSINFDVDNQYIKNMYDCPSWPKTERWKSRKIFCEIHDGFSRLCDCENPLDFQERVSSAGNNESNIFIPLIIMAGNRTRHFFHLLEALNGQENVTRESILVVTDGHVEDVTRLTFILDLKMMVHRPEGKGVMLISRNLRFALYNALRTFPSASAFIVLEDDLIVSPDFYSYMSQLEPIFKLDKSVYCVSAFNHYSYPHTSENPNITYRVQTFPAYGWMMSRAILEEIIPKWMPSTFIIEWDYFLGSDIVAKKRECIIPDINRSYHWATGGIHFSSFFSENLYLRRTLNKVSNVTLSPVERLISENYEKEMQDLLNASIAIQFINKTHFDSQITEGNIYSIYLWRYQDGDDFAFRYFANEMDIWVYDGRDNHKSAWRISYRNCTIIVVGYPHSTYSSFKPDFYKILKATHDLTMQNVMILKVNELKRSHKILTHRNFDSLPL